MAVSMTSLKQLHSELTAIVNEIALEESSSKEKNTRESTAKGNSTKALSLPLMQTILEKTLSPHATVLLPKTLEVATHTRQLLLYIEEINKVVKSELQQFGTLKKPLVMVIPQIKPTPAFITCVMLPQNYQAPCGEATRNTLSEVVFYMDPRVTLPIQVMPLEFQRFFLILTKGCSFTDTIEKRRIEITPTCPKAMFCNGSHQQERDPADNSYWAVYNAMMIVLTGNVHFAKTLKAPLSNIAARFESRLQQFISVKAIAAPVAKATSSSTPGGPSRPPSASVDLIQKMEVEKKATEKETIKKTEKESEKLPQISLRDKQINLILNKLEEIKVRDNKNASGFYSKILNNLIVSYKYLLLSFFRRKNHGLLRDRKIENLQALFNKDKIVKISIYHQKMDLESLNQFFKMIDAGPMALLLKHFDEPLALLKQLENSRRVQYQELKDWEIKLQQELAASESWKIYLKRKGREGLNFVYERSLIHLSSDLLNWMATPFTIKLCNSDTALDLKRRTKQAVKTSADYFNLSASSRARVENTIEYLLSLQQIPRLIRGAGMGIGLYYSYTTGLYPLIRMLGTSTLAMKAIEYVNRIKVNDREATVILPDQDYKTNNRILHIVSLFTALLEAQYAGNYQSFMLSVGGVVSSDTGMRMAMRLLPELQIAPGSRPTEDQLYSLLLLSVALHDLGYLVTGFGLNIYNTICIKERDREYVASIVRSFIVKENQEFLGFTQPPLWSSPTQWFNEENAISISWRNGNTGLFFRSQCKIPFSRVQIPLHAECTVPQEYYPLARGGL